PSLFVLDRPSAAESHNLSLHDALPISSLIRIKAEAFKLAGRVSRCCQQELIHREIPRLQDPTRALRAKNENRRVPPLGMTPSLIDRKSTRLNSSHGSISYAVFCLKKKR